MTWHTSADTQTFACKCCAQCGCPVLHIQTACLKCGMIATYEGTNTKSMISVEALKQVEDDALAATVGLAPQVRVATPAPVEEQPEEEEVEVGSEESAEDAAAAAAGEEGGEMAEAVYEIDENMLRRELARREVRGGLPQLLAAALLGRRLVR